MSIPVSTYTKIIGDIHVRWENHHFDVYRKYSGSPGYVLIGRASLMWPEVDPDNYGYISILWKANVYALRGGPGVIYGPGEQTFDNVNDAVAFIDKFGFR